MSSPSDPADRLPNPNWGHDARLLDKEAQIEALTERVRYLSHSRETGLPGAVLFDEALQRCVDERIGRGDAPALLVGNRPDMLSENGLAPLAVLLVVIDLGPLRYYNARGAYVSDTMLITFAELLEKFCRSSSKDEIERVQAFHLGGDQFALLVEQPKSYPWVSGQLLRVLRAYQEACGGSDPDIPPDANFGVALLTEAMLAYGTMDRYEERIRSTDPLLRNERVQRFFLSIADERATRAKMRERNLFLAAIWPEATPERRRRLAHLLLGDLTIEQVEELASLSSGEAYKRSEQFISLAYARRLAALDDQMHAGFGHEQDVRQICEHLVVSAVIGRNPFSRRPT